MSSPLIHPPWVSLRCWRPLHSLQWGSPHQVWTRPHGMSSPLRGCGTWSSPPRLGATASSCCRWCIPSKLGWSHRRLGQPLGCEIFSFQESRATNNQFHCEGEIFQQDEKGCPQSIHQLSEWLYQTNQPLKQNIYCRGGHAKLLKFNLVFRFTKNHHYQIELWGEGKCKRQNQS